VGVEHCHMHNLL